MSEKPTPEPTPAPPWRASVPRQALHLSIAAAGWVLFGWWWWIVLWHVGPYEVRITGIFLAATLALTVLLTIAWVFHNLRIFRHKAKRSSVRTPREEFLHDRRERVLHFDEGLEAIRDAHAVRIEIEGDRKIYRAVGNVPVRVGEPPAHHRERGDG